MYNTVLFDLDGTISDSFKGIAECIIYALEKFGITVAEDELKEFVGPPLRHTFMRFCGLSELKTLTAISYYSQKYDEIGVDSTTIYRGIKQLLRALKSKGVRLATASTKIQPNVVKVLKKHGIYSLFDYAGGSNPEAGRTEKVDVIAHVLEKLNVTDKSTCLLVGDRRYDLEGAQRCEIDAVAVLYGYGTKEEVSAYNVPTFKTVKELSAYLMANTSAEG